MCQVLKHFKCIELLPQLCVEGAVMSILRMRELRHQEPMVT